MFPRAHHVYVLNFVDLMNQLNSDRIDRGPHELRLTSRKMFQGKLSKQFVMGWRVIYENDNVRGEVVAAFASYEELS